MEALRLIFSEAATVSGSQKVLFLETEKSALARPVGPGGVRRAASGTRPAWVLLPVASVPLRRARCAAA
eukprot:4962569-Alexandrium_andersonii.AAC.1